MLTVRQAVHQKSTLFEQSLQQFDLYEYCSGIVVQTLALGDPGALFDV